VNLAQAAEAAGWSWASLPTVIVSAAAALGLNKALELVITRKSRRGADAKIQVDAGAVISGELRQWAAQAIAQADAANKRAAELETKFQVRIDELVRKLDEAGDKIDEAERRIEKLTARIARCQAGPVCPVRTADTNPGLPVIQPR
jgi:peptidoglycan hydrolase CwlO-like protein